MKPRLALLLLGLCLPTSGCALIEDSARNMCVAISTPIETHREKARNRTWAEEAWQKEHGTEGMCNRSEDYAQGFKDGFAEYLFRGGDGEAPLMAPLRYRHIRYQNQQGYVAIEDWFAGYRHGASVARDTGARRLITGPSGLQGDVHGSMAHESPGMLPGTLPAELTDKKSLPAPSFIDMPMNEVNPPEPVKVDLPMPRPEQTRVVPVETNEKPLVPEPPRIKITNIIEAPPVVPDLPVTTPPVRVKILKVSESTPPAVEPARARFSGINALPQAAPAPSNEAQTPVRARITTITVVPTKE